MGLFAGIHGHSRTTAEMENGRRSLPRRIVFPIFLPAFWCCHFPPLVAKVVFNRVMFLQIIRHIPAYLVGHFAQIFSIIWSLLYNSWDRDRKGESSEEYHLPNCSPSFLVLPLPAARRQGSVQPNNVFADYFSVANDDFLKIWQIICHNILSKQPILAEWICQFCEDADNKEPVQQFISGNIRH